MERGRRPWIGRKFKEVNYYAKQMLSGHGYFRKQNILEHRMGKIAFPYFLYEEGEIINDAEQNVFSVHAGKALSLY